MSLYPKAISKAVARLSELQTGEPNAEAVAASFECGCFVRFRLFVADGLQTIDTEFMSNGCGHMIAACETLVQSLRGTALRELHGLVPSELADIVYKKLGNFSDERRQCCNVAIEALTNTFAAYRRKQLEEFSGEKALICTCFGISEETVETLIRNERVTDVSEISAACNAGSGCGACRLLIQEMIDSASREF